MSIVGFLSTIGILCGCSTSKKNIQAKETIQPIKSLTLPYPAHKDLLAQHQCLYIKDKQPLLYKINSKNTAIQIYLLEDSPVLKDSVIVPSFLQKKNPRFSVISQDSILFYDKYDFWGVYLLNTLTNKIDSLPFPPHPDFVNEKNFSFYLNVTVSNMPYFEYPHLYLSTHTWTKERENEHGLILKYDIIKQKGIYLVDYPNQSPYVENKTRRSHTYNRIEKHFKFVVNQNKIIGFYPIYDTLYVFDRFSGHLLRKEKIPSKYITLPPKKIKKNEEGYFYVTKTPFYKGIFYDPFRKVFYITVKHEMSPDFSTNQ